MKQLLILLLLLSSPVFAVSTGVNNVYIEQVGSTNTITIDQIGGSNNVGGTTLNVPLLYNSSNVITSFIPTAASSSNYATVTGNSNQVTLLQQGDTNWAQYNISGSNNLYNSNVTGNQNQTLFTAGLTGAVSNNVVNEVIIGDLNYIIQNLTKGSITSTINITGSNNEVTTRLNSTNGIVDTTVSGGFNSFINEQDDGGIGHQLTQDFTGSYNSVITQQQGTNDSMIDISTIGDHNTITVRSTNAGSIVNANTAAAR